MSLNIFCASPSTQASSWSRLQQLAADRDDTSSSVPFVFALCKSTTFWKASICDMYNDLEAKIFFFSSEVALSWESTQDRHISSTEFKCLFCWSMDALRVLQRISNFEARSV
uniref:Uncharacterized protein n=1 Tax=Arundo donax TaxID=35708 RepID=A0A0A9CMY6_ARUDO